MRPNIDFGECLKDSPRFRASLEDAEDDIDKLEIRLDKIVKLCHTTTESGKIYNNANKNLIRGIQDLGDYFKSDDLVSTVLQRFAQVLTEIHNYNAILLEQTQKSLGKNINSFIKSDIKKVKESRKHFEKISDDMDQALIKHSSVPKSKLQECEETKNVLTAMRSCFAHTSLDYVFQINVLQSKKRFNALDTMLGYVNAHKTFFHQGHDLYLDHDPHLKSTNMQLKELQAQSVQTEKGMEERHHLVQDRDLNQSVSHTVNDHGDIKMEGYLFKRTSNAFKTWVRRWFMIHDNQLVYRKRTKDTLTTMEDDLRLCNVKPAYEVDKRACFEVVSPTRSHMLQADSESECQAWIEAIQAGVSKAYRDASHQPNTKEEEDRSPRTTPVQSPSSASLETAPDTPPQRLPNPVKARIQQITGIPGNEKCCDCGATDPRWSSMNLGITLCIECSGIHRSFGVHKSKVRSLTLDAWEPEQLKVMAELGNDVVNSIYEAHVDESIAKRASPQCNRDIREAWIKAKYLTKAFLQTLPDKGTEQTGSAKHWSVSRRKRRLWKGKTPTPDKDSTELTVPSKGKDTLSVVQGASQDSGLGGSTQDVIVFGGGIQNDDAIARSIDLSSEDSASDVDPDSKSVTSLEDVSTLDPDRLLYKAADVRNLPVMLEAVANGAKCNWVNENDGGKTPLIMAVRSGSLAASEYLMLNGAKVDTKDGRGQTPLHHATLMGHTGQVCQFLKRNANQHAVDADGNDPLKIAVSSANADIVTLLRLAKLNEEMKETDCMYGTPGDETFNEVFRDFTNMASDDPQRLNRKKYKDSDEQ
ncbi:arf-GAP with coiled-coil, ANK repeat and PH domain-containing protein 2-like isoform X2 [Lineus longissimus]|uniref:arf-GAP with coiled-coil, ANK repeat and PH domain-containing protein 2-like isoform X2 n=1 Tax=Lineus longissimus TaxID=88925 RepID=UPI00315DBBFB